MRSIARADHRASDLWAGRGVASVLALLVCFPLIGPGYTLSYDMVFVPDPVLNARTLGLDGSVPRAVPMDFLVGLLGQALPVPLIQQAALLFCVAVAALGAWRLSPATTLPGAAAAATTYAWSAYVAERLVMGHWSLLLGYALLPWLALFAIRNSRTPDRLPWGLLMLTAAAASAAPTAGVLSGALVLLLVWLLPFAFRSRLLMSVAVMVFNAVWVVPGALASGVLDRSDSGVTAFAVSSDTPLGAALSAVTGGGVWNNLAHVNSRTNNPVSAILTLLVVVVAVLGILLLARNGTAFPGPALLALVVLGAVGLVLALASTTRPGGDLLASLTAHVPGAGILRDAQKWLARYLLLVSVGIGPGIERLARAFPVRQAGFLLTCGALVPVVALPDLAAGVGGRLERTTWPQEYAAVASELNSLPDDGAVVVVPWHAFRAWPWAHEKTVLDPWQRMLDRPVVVRDDLELTSGVVPGEDPEAAAVSALLADGQFDATHLRARGIRYLLIDLATAGESAPEVTGTTVHEGADLQVLDLGDVAARKPGDTSAGVLGADLGAFALLTVAAVASFRGMPRRLIRSRRKLSKGGISSR
jgi:hypothetical protein